MQKSRTRFAATATNGARKGVYMHGRESPFEAGVPADLLPEGPGVGPTGARWAPEAGGAGPEPRLEPLCAAAPASKSQEQPPIRPAHLHVLVLSPDQPLSVSLCALHPLLSAVLGLQVVK